MIYCGKVWPDERTHEGGGRTAQKHNDFADIVGWRRHRNSEYQKLEDSTAIIDWVVHDVARTVTVSVYDKAVWVVNYVLVSFGASGRTKKKVVGGGRHHGVESAETSTPCIK